MSDRASERHSDRQEMEVIERLRERAQVVKSEHEKAICTAI